jgi:hypothetical protein
MTRPTANPFYSRRGPNLPGATQAAEPPPPGVEKVVISNATLYRADCFDVLPQLSGIDAVVTDPPYSIGFLYRSYDEAPRKYEVLSCRKRPFCWSTSRG